MVTVIKTGIMDPVMKFVQPFFLDDKREISFHGPIMKSPRRQGVLRTPPGRQEAELTRPVSPTAYEMTAMRLTPRTQPPARLMQTTIHSERLTHNAEAIRTVIGPNVKLCAVVKANAYGHGATGVVKTLAKTVDAFAVATIAEALTIRPHAGDRMILVTTPLFAGMDPRAIQEAARQDIHGTLCSVAAADYLDQCLIGIDKPLSVHVKVDTGMGRCGAWSTDAVTLLKALPRRQGLHLAGVFTHFAGADEAHLEHTEEQLIAFRRFLLEQDLEGRSDLCIHACNTEATLRVPAAHFGMVRCGLGIYGAVRGELARRFDLQPTLKLTAPLVQIKFLPKGRTCGYGRTFAAPHDMIIGIVAAGYADGLRRCLSNRAAVLVNHKPAPIIGRISMDLTIIDLTHHPVCHEGEPVTLIDDAPESPCSAVTLARQADTIPYEILTGIKP